MKAIYAFLLVLVIIFAGNYWYSQAGLVCALPIEYSIGEFDDRFGIDRDQAVAALTAAEAVWEDSLGRDDIFQYNEEGKGVQVNFIYDERQRQADAASNAKDDLDVRGEANEVLVELHAQLVSEYKAHEQDYETKRSAYEAELAAYNAEVEKYNSQGGAPPDVYEELERQRVDLDVKRGEINALMEKLNELSYRINEIGDKGNELINEYNNRVRQFNDTYVHEHEYTQGDYQGRAINVYTFSNQDELTLVLAHEFGHSLAIDHLEGTSSIMYYLMGGQPLPPTLSEEDIAAFTETCDINTFQKMYRAVYNGLINRG